MVTLNDTSGRGPGPVQGVAGSMMVETICCARSCESRLWTSTCQPRPKLRTLCGGIVTGLVSRIVPGAVAGSTSGGAEYQGSGDGLGYAIIQSRWTMDYVSAFACIAVIAILGLGMERLVLMPLERRTLARWGMVAAPGTASGAEAA